MTQVPALLLHATKKVTNDDDEGCYCTFHSTAVKCHTTGSIFSWLADIFELMTCWILGGCEDPTNALSTHPLPNSRRPFCIDRIGSI